MDTQHSGAIPRRTRSRQASGTYRINSCLCFLYACLLLVRRRLRLNVIPSSLLLIKIRILRDLLLAPLACRQLHSVPVAARNERIGAHVSTILLVAHVEVLQESAPHIDSSPLVA